MHQHRLQRLAGSATARRSGAECQCSVTQHSLIRSCLRRRNLSSMVARMNRKYDNTTAVDSVCRPRLSWRSYSQRNRSLLSGRMNSSSDIINAQRSSANISLGGRNPQSTALCCLSSRHRSFNALRFFTTDSNSSDSKEGSSSTQTTTESSETSDQVSETPKKKKKISSSTTMTSSGLDEMPTGRGTAKSFIKKTVTKKHTTADGRVKESTQSALRMERVVSDGSTEVNVSTEMRNVQVKQSKPLEPKERETVIKEMSKKEEKISIRDLKGEGREQSEENISSTFTERTDLEELDEQGRVVGLKERRPSSESPSGSSQSLSEHPDLIHTYDRTPYISGKLSVYELKYPMTKSELLVIGNPTDEELERRKDLLITPHALMIHPDRLLPTILKSGEKKKKSFAGRMWDSFYSVTRSIRNKVIGDEKWEQVSETVRSTYAQAQENWDTTQNPHLVAVRSLVDKLNIQTETSRAMEILQEEMEDFWVEDFLPEFSENILPIVIRAFFNEDLSYLQQVCVGEAHVFVSNTIQGRQQAGLLHSNDILWINEAELVETKLSKEKKPQIIVRAEVQTVDCVYDRKTREVVQGAPSLVANNVFVMTLETCLDEEHLNTVGYPWCIRSLQTAKVKQLI